MEPGSNVVCDSNICVYRTLAVAEPKVYNHILTNTQRFINDLTNTGQECMIIITPTVQKELIDKNDSSFILIKSIQNFCVKNLHWAQYDSRIQKIIRNSEKSIKKFIEKYKIEKQVNDFNVNYDVEVPKIDRFYLKHPKKLAAITKQKISRLTGFKKADKIAQRPNNLPEENDRKILAECIEVDKLHNGIKTYILTNDSDFTEFKDEIEEDMSISVAIVPEYN